MKRVAKLGCKMSRSTSSREYCRNPVRHRSDDHFVTSRLPRQYSEEVLNVPLDCDLRGSRSQVAQRRSVTALSHLEGTVGNELHAVCKGHGTPGGALASRVDDGLDGSVDLGEGDLPNEEKIANSKIQEAKAAGGVMEEVRINTTDMRTEVEPVRYKKKHDLGRATNTNSRRLSPLHHATCTYHQPQSPRKTRGAPGGRLGWGAGRARTPATPRRTGTRGGLCTGTARSASAAWTRPWRGPG